MMIAPAAVGKNLKNVVANKFIVLVYYKSDFRL